MHRHVRESYFVVGEGLLSFDRQGRPARTGPPRRGEQSFRFSRLGPEGEPTDPALIERLAEAMTTAGRQPDSADPTIPAGFTYLGQFVDHDMTLDQTDVDLGEEVPVDDLVGGRSPSLDLDSVYGRGPRHPQDRRYYAEDGVGLKTGTTAAVPGDPGTNVDREGFDLPRAGVGETKAEQRAPLIPDARNDENLAVAQTHLAFIHFHNRAVEALRDRGVRRSKLFEEARAEVVRHYQWMLRTDFLPRIVDPAMVDEVFTEGRRFVQVAGSDWHRRYGGAPAMPIEFAVAAYRLGHSMVRGVYQWNRVFNSTSPARIATLFQLFTFTGTSGILSPTDDPADLDDPNAGDFLRLPTNWIVDWRRLHDFTDAGRPELLAPEDTGGGNITQRIDTLLVNPLDHLPAGTFGGREQGLPQDAIQRNLAFRNLTRANMVRLASGQQMAEMFGVAPLTADQILTGDGTGADLGALTAQQRDALVAATPLWFYVLREAEQGGGRMGAVGGRIVAEVFHLTMEASRSSIVRDRHWRPWLGPDSATFRMIDLLLFAFDGKADHLNPLGDSVL